MKTKSKIASQKSPRCPVDCLICDAVECVNYVIARKLKTKKWTAEKIKKLRLKYYLSQEDMANIVGVTQQLIQRLEAGKHDIGRMTEIAWEKIEEHISSKD